MNDRNLICFFSWGRSDLTQKGFRSLLESKRSQDRLLVIDQEGLNRDFYFKNWDKIDFIFFLKKNYHISPVWKLIKNFVKWFPENNKIYHCEKNKDVELAWQPDYINIVECDTIGKVGWIDRVLKGFETNKNVTIVSGYNGSEHEVIKRSGAFLIKKIVNGVNVIIRTNDFIDLLDGLLTRKLSMDWYISQKNIENGKLVAVLPDEIIHTGIYRSRKK